MSGVNAISAESLLTISPLDVLYVTIAWMFSILFSVTFFTSPWNVKKYSSAVHLHESTANFGASRESRRACNLAASTVGCTELAIGAVVGVGRSKTNETTTRSAKIPARIMRGRTTAELAADQAHSQEGRSPKSRKRCERGFASLYAGGRIADRSNATMDMGPEMKSNARRNSCTSAAGLTCTHAPTLRGRA